MLGARRKYYWRDHDCLYRILFEALQDAVGKERLGRPYANPPEFGDLWEGETERFPADREQRLYLTYRGAEMPSYVLYLPDNGKPHIEKAPAWEEIR